MKYFKLSSLLFILFIIIYSCNKNVSTKIIEERDPIIKTLEERDSIRIIPADTSKNKPLHKK
jgi:hypothetical protein